MVGKVIMLVMVMVAENGEGDLVGGDRDLGGGKVIMLVMVVVAKELKPGLVSLGSSLRPN